MPRKLKVYQTSMGFFELAVAAPSMKAAAEAWGADPDIFRRGFAEETGDAKVVEAAMASPGVVLRRPVGSTGTFTEKAGLPKAPKTESRKPTKPEAGSDPSGTRREPEAKLADKAKREEAAAREKEAAAAREKEEKQREQERRKKEAEEERARKRREQMIAKADAALEKARAKHDETMKSLAARRSELAEEEARENERWEREQRDHEDALRQAES